MPTPRRGSASTIAGLLACCAAFGTAQAATPTFHFDLPAEPLSQALRDYGRITGRQILFAEALVNGQTAPALHDELTAEDALHRLLVNTKLRYQSTASGALILSGQAGADFQTPPEAQEGGSQVSEVVVTANKKLERQIDVASAVTAVSGESLEARRLTRIEDFAAQVPGLSLQTLGYGGGIKLILRGLNAGGNGATVATLLDEASLTFVSNYGASVEGPNIDTFDLARVEVLRGPQGTLYGAAAEGGLLKYVFNTPDPTKVEARAESDVSDVSHGEIGYAFRGLVNIPISSTVALRGSGFYQKDPGYIDDPLASRKNVNSGERYGGRLSLLWKPNETFNIRLVALRDKQASDGGDLFEVTGVPSTNTVGAGSGQFDIANGGRFQHNTYIAEPYTRRTDFYAATVNLTLDLFDITSVTAYGKNRSTFVVDYSDTPAFPGVTYGEFLGAAVYGQAIAAYGLQDGRYEKFSQEVRFASKPSARLMGLPVEIQAGVFYTSERAASDQVFSVSPLANLNTILTFPTPLGGSLISNKYEETSGFADATLHLTSRLKLGAGVRYTDNTVTTRAGYVQGLLNPVPTPLFYEPSHSVSEQPVTWSFSAGYEVSSHANFYGRIASGYRPGGANIGTPGIDAILPNFTSDSTVNYELGYKADIFRRAISVDIAAFYIDWTNIQVPTSVQSGAIIFNVTGNAGTATSQGFEWNLGWTPLPGLTFSDAGAYTDATLGADAPNLGGLKGDQLPFVPQVSNTVNADYSRRLAGDATGFVGATWSFVDTRNGGFNVAPVVENKPRLPSYNTLALRAGVQTGRYRVEAYAQNLSDERGIGGYQSTGGYQGRGLAAFIRPRTIGLRVGVTY